MASKGQDAAMNGLLRRNLTRAARASESCPDSEILAAYYERVLDSQEVARWEAHFSQCAQCREQLAMMVRAEEHPQPASARGWLWDWRLLVATAAAAMVMTVWMVHVATTPYTRTETASQPLVAMSQRAQTLAEQAKDAAPPSLDRPERKAETEAQRDTAKIRPERRAPGDSRANLPLNGRNFDDLRELKPAPNILDGVGPSAELKKAEKGPAASSAAAPAPAAPATEEAGTANGILAIQANESADSKTRAADNPGLKQKALGLALGRTAAQLAEQRSGTTIIQTPDPKILWRIAGGNFVERTENSGASWHGQVADPDAQLTAGAAPSTKVCWLVGKAGAIVVTKDATHWKRIAPPVPADFVAIEAKNSSSAIVTAADGQKFSTDNEGKKWVPLK